MRICGDLPVGLASAPMYLHACGPQHRHRRKLHTDARSVFALAHKEGGIHASSSGGHIDPSCPLSSKKNVRKNKTKASGYIVKSRTVGNIRKEDARELNSCLVSAQSSFLNVK